MQLSGEQLRILSGITANAGQVFFGATVVPFILGIDKTHPGVLLSGLALTLMFWITSIMLVERKTS